MFKHESDTIGNLSGRLLESGLFSEFDIYFARFIAGLDRQEEPEVFIGAALVSRSAAAGHVCLDLSAMSETVLIDRQNERDAVTAPNLMQWRKKLLTSAAVGKPDEYCPLVLDPKNRLYLYRHWQYEQSLAGAIKRRSTDDMTDIDRTILKNGAARLFPGDEGSTVDMQKVAAMAAVTKRFCVIAGGPGTGKTYLVAKILTLLLEQGNGNLNIYLSAPTGKAAARLKETLDRAKADIPIRPDIDAFFPDEAYTIHRMLKPIPASPHFRYNRDCRLPADVVVVDEVSMVDMALMAKLCEALPEHARLILIGDKDQLASVEAGSVLGDICFPQAVEKFSIPFCRLMTAVTDGHLDDNRCDQSPISGLQDCITVLDKSHRFPDAGGIGDFSRLINTEDVEGSLTLLKNSDDAGLDWLDVSAMSMAVFQNELARKVQQGYGRYLSAVDPSDALRQLARFMVLCAVRRGPFGVESVNAYVQSTLRRTGLIRKTGFQAGEWYAGRPVLITRNHYDLGLFNGDIGVTLPGQGSAEGRLYVFFPGPDGDVRRFLPHRLPEHETAFAMTVHKSQGSEFDHILLVLPDRDAPLLTKELVYTGVTRARKSVTVWGAEPVVRAALARKIQRTSGLADLLWE